MSKQSSSQDARYARNFGFISQGEQAKLATTVVAIAGVGGVGGKAATDLVRLGVTRLRLADPDTFSVTNLNRQEGCTTSTLGQKKAAVIAAMCHDINPDVVIETFLDGVDEANVDQFMDGVDILVEATDFMLPYLGVMLARNARSRQIPVIMGVEIGFGATLTWFKPTGYSYEKYFGLNPDVSLNELKNGHAKVAFSRWLPHVPGYGDLKILQQISDGATDVPAIAPAVSICAALIVTQITALIKGSGSLPPAPSVYHFDAREHRSRVIRFPGWHYHLSLAWMIIRNLTGRADKIATR